MKCISAEEYAVLRRGILPGGQIPHCGIDCLNGRTRISHELADSLLKRSLLYVHRKCSTTYLIHLATTSLGKLAILAYDAHHGIINLEGVS